MRPGDPPLLFPLHVGVDPHTQPRPGPVAGPRPGPDRPGEGTLALATWVRRYRAGAYADHQWRLLKPMTGAALLP